MSPYHCACSSCHVYVEIEGSYCAACKLLFCEGREDEREFDETEPTVKDEKASER